MLDLEGNICYTLSYGRLEGKTGKKVFENLQVFVEKMYFLKNFIEYSNYSNYMDYNFHILVFHNQDTLFHLR